MANRQDEESPRNISDYVFLVFTVGLIININIGKLYWPISIVPLSLLKLYFIWLDGRSLKKHIVINLSITD